jgi:predicted PhzF superfamily epimerase YddE/YHI9
MHMKVRQFQEDAFTGHVFAGDPAAVCPLEQWPDDELLQRIPEDPVTGSAHCQLAPWWAARLGRNPLHARQISRRGGDLICRVSGDRVILSGEAVTFMSGEIAL